MYRKRGFEYPWAVLASLVILVLMIIIYFVFSKEGTNTLANVGRYIRDLFRFG